MISTQFRHLTAFRAYSQFSLTFFTKDTCQLCKNASVILSKTLEHDDFKNIKVDVVDIMKPGNESAFDKYCYDVPVLHVDRPNRSKPVKFMHYFDEQKLAEEFRSEE